jgi:hypothetical protein
MAQLGGFTTTQFVKLESRPKSRPEGDSVTHHRDENALVTL